MSAPAGGDKKNIVKMAYIYFQEGRWDKAIEEYKKLIDLDPEDINTHNMLGDVYVKKGSIREAFEEYLKVSTDFSSRGQSDKAAIVNKKIAALDSALLSEEARKKQSLFKQTLKAETAMDQGDVDAAIEALSEVLKLDVENLTAYAKLGELFEKKGRIQEAVQQYQVLGATFFKNRLYKKSQEMYQRAVQLDPNNLDVRMNLAQIAIKQGSESDAKKEFLSIAELALAAGDLESANTYAAKAVEFKSIEAHYVLGVIFLKKQKLSEAKTEFESLLRFKVNHVGALTNLGKVLLEMGQADKAAESIQKALKLEKDNLVALEAWVELSVKKGNKPEAISTLNVLVDRYKEKGDSAKAGEFASYMTSLDENSIPAFTKLGELLAEAGDKAKAADAFFKVALLFEKQEKKDKAMEFVRKTLELNQGHAEAQKRLMGEVAGSGASAQKAPSAASPKVPEIKFPTTGVMDLEQENEKPVAPPKSQAPPPAATVEKPKPAAPEPSGAEDLAGEVAIADNYIKQGLVEEAIEIYQQLIEAHPDHPELKQKLNQAYTAYVKTGEDVIGALEAEKKAKEEVESKLRQEMEKKAQEEAARLKSEFEAKLREEADKKVRDEMERAAREEALRKAKEEVEKRSREEAESKAREESLKRSREEMEKRAREEAEKRIREETDQRMREEKERAAKKTADPVSFRQEPPSKGEGVLEEGRDEFMTIAVADIYRNQGLFAEASKIYRRILQMEPDNLEARKKLSDLEGQMKSKGEEPPPASAHPAPPPSSPAPGPPASGPEKDSGGKKRPSRVGYV